MVNYSCEKFSLTTNLLAKIHRLKTNGETNRLTEGRTDDNHANSSTAT